jgi:hypothetical protein
MRLNGRYQLAKRVGAGFGVITGLSTLATVAARPGAASLCFFGGPAASFNFFTVALSRFTSFFSDLIFSFFDMTRPLPLGFERVELYKRLLRIPRRAL